MGITHAFTSPKEDGGDMTVVLPSDWNADHIGSVDSYLDVYSLPRDGTMGDDFDGASLNGRWSRRNITSGMEMYQQFGGSYLLTTVTSGTTAQQYYQACPSGNWEFIVSVASLGTATRMYGLGALDSSGNGLAVLFYTDGSTYNANIGSYTYAGNNGGMGPSTLQMAGMKTWYRIRKSGTTISLSWSINGLAWGAESSVTDSRTWAEVTVGRFYGSSTNDPFAIDMFDRVS